MIKKVQKKPVEETEIRLGIRFLRRLIKLGGRENSTTGREINFFVRSDRNTTTEVLRGPIKTEKLC